MRASTIITGANSGIGLAMASALLDRGHRVAVFDLAGDSLGDLAHAHRCDLKFIECDVTDEAGVALAVASVDADWGGVDTLINNACICGVGPFEERTVHDIRRELEVNLMGYINTVRAVLPTMKRQGHGLIYNMGSGIGITGFAGASIYSASKGAIEAFSRSLALELSVYGITVSIMHPPLTRTPSASPLGVPVEAMADPMVVGRRLAARVGYKSSVIAPDFMSRFSLALFRRYPDGAGKLLSNLTARARSGKHRA